MIKTLFKILLVILFVIVSILFFNRKINNHNWGSYTPIILDRDEDVVKALDTLGKLGFNGIIYEDGISIGINNYIDLEERGLKDISSLLDKNDYRNTPYISNLNSLFRTKDDNKPIMYVKLDRTNIFSIYNIYKAFEQNAIPYKVGDPLFMRVVLNYLSFILLLLLFGFGCRTRVIISILSGVIAYLYMDASSLYKYSVFFIGYFLIIMIVESISFSNRYIKRNNIGIIRVLLGTILFILPSFFPIFIDLSNTLYTPIPLEETGFGYENLENSFDESTPNISNYFTHYAYQKSFLYGDKYLFPTYGNSVTIDEFKREDYYLSRNEKVVFTYDDDYLSEFLSYCDTTALGRFYKDYGRPFKLELNSLLSLYTNSKEYTYVGILAICMFFSSFFFKKGRDKKLKY
ncbi:hypothetical protein EW093_03525 [Thiospirochaeta perfilievii]|uniref:Uncharacterized protein n=1 Tax=Thiospirochaeta perfilievii TaxID=252967 RepID=A0A5C1Q8Q2_9SPIO|nr:hypothetical protein [Thiospirochaeta perfilievii]QEN03807.1 hypothetical protein EW093_03525 [Thiospirochaeta perfilievii]